MINLILRRVRKSFLEDMHWEMGPETRVTCLFLLLGLTQVMLNLAWVNLSAEHNYTFKTHTLTSTATPPLP